MNISVAGVAERDGKYLVALRKPGTSIGVRWEFPGGKLEKGETPEEAVIREYMEELNISVRVKERLCEGSFSNGEKYYRLLAYKIEIGDGEITAPEHQQIFWAALSELGTLDFPVSDMIIVNYLLSA
ncbi:MAG: (deoxy)nucleoside triphosphate pyrophosphohydrolase [Spirochaetales bacterium]|nr:(deoxy)nucleoside triphosphate pyrophosphohydrolase [Spirochaetales bacterium]